jgi:hypothetical protein
MPMLTFYFPFPFLLIAILDWFIPYTVAFKIITVLGVFALPATAYGLARLWRVRKPFPILAAVFALAMLLMESYSIYGGNILSTLAGEFGYMLSFALVWLLLGTLHRGMQKPGLNMFFVLNCLLLMCLVLSHIVTTIVLITLVPGLLLVNFRWKSLLYVVAVAFVGLCLTAFWWLPFASNLEWTAHMAWNQLHGWKDVLPPALIPVATLALIGIAYAIARKERKLLPLAWITIVTMAVFWALPDGRLWNARVLPFFYMSVHLWAAYGATWLIRPFAVMMRDLFRLRGLTSRRVYVPVVAIVIGAVLVITSQTAGAWIKWNYSGYEGKAHWAEYKQILDFLNTLEPTGRVMTEHGQKIDELGTPRAFEIIPYWTDQDTMEGTLMEASYTAAFHFINQAELSEQASNAIIGVDYPGVDVHRGLTHLQLMNIPYLITFVNADTEERVTPGVQQDGRAQELAVFGDYHIFRISGTTGYVEVMKNEPVRVSIPQAEWRDMANKWYLNEDALDTPIVWDNGEKPLQQFQEVTAEDAENPPEVPIDSQGEGVISETFSNEKLEFDTTAIGKPHWIKISYFPNWHVEGADGPYLASPSMMMVIPTQSHVTLYYGRTAANTIGQSLEVFGWVLLVALTLWRTVVYIRRRRLRDAVVDSGAVLAGPVETAELEPPVHGRYDGVVYGDEETRAAGRDQASDAAGFADDETGLTEDDFLDEDPNEDANWRVDDLEDEDDEAVNTDY